MNQKLAISFCLEGEVTDADDLMRAAITRTMEESQCGEDEARDFLHDEGEPNYARCLVMLLDPGSMPGFQILESSAEETGSPYPEHLSSLDH